ncbi:hypothetical protein TNCV_2535091 [Trichonephila clavipes]|nr:hypothetical protein TNCV_2535091 [Trichonephila clavipes]
MYKNALKEDLIRVEDLDSTVESTDTIAKLKTKIEKSSTFESDADFVKTLIKNCIDERETATDIGIRDAKDWFRPIDLAKECDIYFHLEADHSLSVPSFLYVSDSPLVSMKKKRNKYRCGQRTVRLAVVEYLAKHAVFARRRSKSKLKQKPLRKEQRKTEVREQALPSSHHGNPIVE